MPYPYRTPDDNKPRWRENARRRYATTAIVLAGTLVGGSLVSSYASRSQTNFGRPFIYNGQQYYVAGDSKRAVYPDKEACLRDVPAARQSECEPVSNYRGSGAHAGSWYGPVFNPRDNYKPGSQFPTEEANSSNIGKQLPSGSSSHGFGTNGKAFTGSKGS